MGVALSCQNRYDQAVEAYKKALEIDPNNESYRQNLSIAENKLAEAQAAMAGNAPVRSS
jgi:small glutamine-rich tetratricopeptide repeat-containing protein alpha